MTAQRERADAARNREAILAAAAELFDRTDAGTVSMNDIAEAAGVGKGTLFRRFSDRGALIEAVLARRATALLRSEKDPGSDAGPTEPVPALLSYLDDLLDFVWANRSLIRALDHSGPNGYYTSPASQHWIAELTRRISAARPGVDADYLGHILYTAVRADAVDYLHTARGMSLDRIRAGLHALAMPALAEHPAIA
ncbi:TetR/AcrR family transcriptional regulator [Frankia sp. CNm7]|uniref:TetR/AcrR family transcriptional regulator n=1 Tax=Frankia nepalensis TaxID=1836974 RepID=A0A937USD8_9ACTN|nr:TetR/AcrR family transcriptional regulator [Frankia nepalensis]MBL7501491.1 TetR/AcrR family transcriptional regulator [Frankia nepalensis]MBL7513619.1 TetR/AcrR family transcriptional regulator [Frankia nepalensis]MBL7523840.1 TetR/AcrR family transcriptional regulator [Frankia nepalensis]MBL7633764.1 TetR/AcrR family transcriptional regulator [Frankia nepalensis]